MAKFNGLFGKMRGKYGGGVFAVIKGQNILREYNGEPANPRSYAQQAQRALLANMTKFYKRATQNFYKFAFEDKTTRESDYNAFARNNIKRGAYLTREQYDSNGWPAIGRYIMTKGSLPVQLEYGWLVDVFGIRVPEASAGTLGALSSYILQQNPSLAAGDLVTFVRAWSALDISLADPLESPEWEIVQFYLDASDARTPASIGLDASSAIGPSSDVILGMSIDGTTSISMGSVCISRVTANGLLVSNSELKLSPMGQAAMDWLMSAYQKRVAAVSWGGNPEAVLAGGELPYLPTISTISIATQSAAAWQRRDISFAAGQGVALSLQGQNLKTTANGGRLIMRYYAADGAGVADYPSLSPSSSTPITMTGSATNITATIPRSVLTLTTGDDPAESAQGFYSLEYEGVCIAYGTVIAA